MGVGGGGGGRGVVRELLFVCLIFVSFVLTCPYFLAHLPHFLVRLISR